MVSEHTASSWEFHTLFSLENRKVTNYRSGCGGKRVCPGCHLGWKWVHKSACILIYAGKMGSRVAATASRAQEGSGHPTCFSKRMVGNVKLTSSKKKYGSSISRKGSRRKLSMNSCTWSRSTAHSSCWVERVMEEASNDEPTLQPHSLAQPYPLVLKEELLELRKGHPAELWPFSSPAGKERKCLATG